MGYTKDTMRGVGWVGGLRLITRIVSFARIAILARLLSPVQFGVFGIAMLVTALLEVLTETGINVILVQEKNDIKESVNFLSNTLYGAARQYIPAIVGFLVAGRDEEGVHLYEVGIDGSIIKYEDYISDGSGMMYAIGTLEANYRKNMAPQDTVKLTVQAINSSMQRDAASGNGVEVYLVTKDEIKKVFDKDINSIISV